MGRGTTIFTKRFENYLGDTVNSDKKLAEMEQNLRKLKNELFDREQDLSIYRAEVKRLNQALSEILAGMDQDIDMVKKIFKLLVPTQFPHISGFHFSTKFMSGMRFNGDYLDVFEQKDRFKFNLIMSSSSGPSLTALLIAFLLKFGRDLNGVAASPETFVERVLQEIKEKNEKASEIQLACLLVDKKRYEMSYCLHGSITCLYQCGETAQVQDLSERTQKTSIKLKPYDRLVMVSPGLLGAQDSQGRVFSSTAVLEAMAQTPLSQSVHDLRNEVFYKLDRHLGERKPMQDVSLIVMSVSNNIIKLV